MKITTKMKRNATSERWWKASKEITSNTNLITSFWDFDKPEEAKMKTKKKKTKEEFNVWDMVQIRYLSLYTPRLKEEWAPFYNRREEELINKFRESSIIWWFNHLIEIEILNKVQEWKLITYYWKYYDLDVAFDNRFNKITKIN